MQEIKIAKVLKPQGIKGEIKVELFYTDLDFWYLLKNFKIDKKEYDILKLRIKDKNSVENNKGFSKIYAYIQSPQILDRNKAEELRGKFLFANKPSINDGEYFISELENCCLIDEDENILGYVDSVEKYSSTPIVNIILGGAKKSFPFLQYIIKKVDIKEKKIIVFKDKLLEVLV